MCYSLLFPPNALLQFSSLLWQGRLVSCQDLKLFLYLLAAHKVEQWYVSVSDLCHGQCDAAVSANDAPQSCSFSLLSALPLHPILPY